MLEDRRTFIIGQLRRYERLVAERRGKIGEAQAIDCLEAVKAEARDCGLLEARDNS